MELDMTSGKPLNTLLKFSLPLLAGSVIQNLYNIFDTAIVGHVLGKYALAAVGNSYVPTLIINSIVLGIASGISILVAQLYGSKDKGQICKCYGSVQTLIVAVGFGLAVLFFALAGWIFKAMQIPEEITSPAALYLRIVAAGIPFLAIYNFYSALIKAKGDSRTPIRCICLSCVLNILLDYLFVACFGWGIVGAASATVLSQALAAVLVGLHLYRQEHPVIRTAPSAGLIVPILQLSITGIVQNGASAISMFFIQGIINTFGVNEISAYTSAYKIESILTIPAVNLGVALSVYIGQNVGAGEYDRTRQGLKDSFKIAAVFTTLAMAILWFASPLLMVLVVGKEMAVIPIGVQYLRIISVTFPLCVSLYLLTNFLRGAGEIAYPLFNTLLELCFRTFSAFVLAHYFGFVGVLLCRPLSFVVSTISLSCQLLSGKWKDKINHSV